MGNSPESGGCGGGGGEESRWEEGEKAKGSVWAQLSMAPKKHNISPLRMWAQFLFRPYLVKEEIVNKIASKI